VQHKASKADAHLGNNYAKLSIAQSLNAAEHGRRTNWIYVQTVSNANTSNSGTLQLGVVYRELFNTHSIRSMKSSNIVISLWKAYEAQVSLHENKKLLRGFHFKSSSPFRCSNQAVRFWPSITQRWLLLRLRNRTMALSMLVATLLSRMSSLMRSLARCKRATLRLVALNDWASPTFPCKREQIKYCLRK